MCAKAANNWQDRFIAKHRSKIAWGPRVSDGTKNIGVKGCRGKKLCALKESLEARQEADFQSLWRERRDNDIRPPAVGALTGKERLDALKARLATRLLQGAPCSSSSSTTPHVQL